MFKKRWLQVEVVNEIVMHSLLSFISNLDFKLLLVPIEANLGSVYSAIKFNQPDDFVRNENKISFNIAWKFFQGRHKL